ncbi:hypothetical protein D3C71_1565500 [compost metagenome]
MILDHLVGQVHGVEGSYAEGVGTCGRTHVLQQPVGKRCVLRVSSVGIDIDDGLETDNGVIKQRQVAVLRLPLADDHHLLSQATRRQGFAEANGSGTWRQEDLQDVWVGVGDALGHGGEVGSA